MPRVNLRCARSTHLVEPPITHMREQITAARRLWPLTGLALLSVAVFVAGLLAGPA